VVDARGCGAATELKVGPTDPRYPGQFVAGYHLALLVAAAVAFAGAIVAVLTVRQVHQADPRKTPARSGAAT
jgi:hypothetical protein